MQKLLQIHAFKRSAEQKNYPLSTEVPLWAVYSRWKIGPFEK